ncbi:MAG: outer membrane beta-barrel family protein [Petrimonas sp.]|nr:outer membrane beta-barrel family protein [Petrimonas sp.]
MKYRKIFTGLYLSMKQRQEFKKGLGRCLTQNVNKKKMYNKPLAMVFPYLLPATVVHWKMKLLSVILLSIIPSVLQSRDIEGSVVDAEGQPFGFVNAVLYTNDSVYISGCVTDSSGYFRFQNLPDGSYILKISFLGYNDKFRDFNIDGNSIKLEPIVLTESTIELDTVTVTARRPVYQLEGGGLKVNVANSILQNETKPIDVLRKIPGMTLTQGELQVFGFGAPVIYINGKKAQSFDEVERLGVKDIQSVTLLTNPGAAYDASGSPVLLIVTKNKDNGLMFQLDGDIYKGNRINHTEGVNMSYQRDGLTLFGSYRFMDKQTESYENMISGIRSDTVWNYNSRENQYADDKKNSYQAGINYNLNPNHSLGMQYDGISKDGINEISGTSEATANNEPYENLDIQSKIDQHIKNHHLNLFYRGKWSENLAFNMYGDYVRNKLTREQHTNETNETSNIPNLVFITSRSDFDVYAIKGVFNYSMKDKGSVSFGGDYSFVKGNNTLDGENNTIENASSRNTESKRAAFVSYAFSSGKLDLIAGLRYESLLSKMHDFKKPSNNIDREYNNLFPSLSLNYITGNVSHSLNYSVSTTRPDFDILNTNVYYTNRFNYQIGNPSVKPAIWNQANYSLRYKFIYLNLIYANAKNYIGYNFYTDKENPSVVVTSYTNYGRYQRLAAALNLNYQFGFWEPTVSLYYLKPFFKMDYMGKPVAHDKPCYNIGWDNGFTLPKGFYLNAEYQYSSPSSYLMFELGATNVVNLRLQKPFLKDRLQITLYGNDLFNGNKVKMNGLINTISFDQREIPDSRNFGVSVIFRFNNYKKTKEYNSAEDEMERLKVK